MEVGVFGQPLFRGVPDGPSAGGRNPGFAPHRKGDSHGLHTQKRQTAQALPGAALTLAENKEKNRKRNKQYPEFEDQEGPPRARLVTVACEAGGRWSDQATSFVRNLAKCRAE